MPDPLVPRGSSPEGTWVPAGAAPAASAGRPQPDGLREPGSRQWGDASSLDRDDRTLYVFIEQVVRTGYRQTRVEDVCRRAGVSTRCFYDWFDSKDECYLKVFDRFGRQVIGRAKQAARAVSNPWEARVRAALEAATGELMAHPILTQFLLEYRNVEGSGTAWLRLVADVEEIYLTEEIREHILTIPRPVQESVVCSLVLQPIARCVEAGNLHQLPELVPWSLYHLTLHFLGSDRAEPLRPA